LQPRALATTPAGQLIERLLGVCVSFALILDMRIEAVIGQSVHEIDRGQGIATIDEPPGLDLLDGDPQDESIVLRHEFVNFLLDLNGALVEQDDVKGIAIDLAGDGGDQSPDVFEDITPATAIKV
jgi:hypothetical protein